MKHVRAIRVHAADNVVTLVQVGAAGDVAEWEGASVIVSDDVPKGHKVAVSDIPEGGVVTKYGASIGVATKAIKAGQWVHVHNIRSARGKGAHE